MIVAQHVTILTPERVTEIGKAFFAAQASGEAWLCDASIDDLATTILDRRARLRAVVAGAPDSSRAPAGQRTWRASLDGRAVRRPCH